MHHGQRSTPTFTVFTPTFNRAETLHRVYESLSQQTFRDFDWLIVEDGSTDNSAELVQGWQEQADFPIRYLYQENRGVIAARNRGVREARGELFLPADSDDSFIADALERFYGHWTSIPERERSQFSAVTACCVDQHGQLVGTELPQSPLDSDSLEIRYRYRMRGERWGFHRTEVLRRFPFPEDPPTHEGVVWDEIARHYKTRFVSDRLRVYWRDEPGREDQVSRHTSPTTKPEGFVVGQAYVLNRNMDWFRYAPVDFLIAAIHYSRFSFHARYGVGRQVRTLENRIARLLLGAALLPAFLLYQADRHPRARSLLLRVKRMRSR